MNNFLSYLLEVSGVFSCLTLLYVIVLKRLTFHTLNRFVLLLTLPISLLLPTFELPFRKIVTVDLQASFFEAPPAPVTKTEELGIVNASWDIFFWMKVIYCLGVGVYLIILVLNVYKLFQLKHSSPSTQNNGYLLIRSKVPTVFSCFNWIFIPHNTEYEKNHPVIQHEKAHFLLLHTADLLVTEIFTALTWFNPFVYLFQKLLKSVHEFQVDEHVLRRYVSKSDYLTLMLEHLTSADYLRFSNNFKNSMIKNRIDMITKQKSNITQTLRYISIAPLLTLLLVFFSAFSGTEPSLFPIKEGGYEKITSPFGVKRKNPFSGKYQYHHGIDIKATKGTPVIATGAGTVIKAKEEGAWGNLVVIDHGDNIVTWYAHLEDFTVREGQTVMSGEEIGHVGSTGKSTAPHLHYEVRLNGEKVDPARYFKKN